MAQIKIYGVKEHLDQVKGALSDIIHSCVVDALQYPPDKRAHRFLPLAADDFYYPPGRTEQYTIIEISMFEGRSVEAKKRLINLLFERISMQLRMSTQDIEITIFETPKHNWGIRGVPGDELVLNYEVRV
jgi:phenylpyruvate tautomerase PptA (4-oxalocrotonate tautomerase family)